MATGNAAGNGCTTGGAGPDTQAAGLNLGLRNIADPVRRVRRSYAGASRWSGTWLDAELVAQEQVLEHEVVARAHPGKDGRGQQPEQFEHAFSIADPALARGLAARQAPTDAPPAD
jgi:hypothetical protein